MWLMPPACTCVMRWADVKRVMFAMQEFLFTHFALIEHRLRLFEDAIAPIVNAVLANQVRGAATSHHIKSHARYRVYPPKQARKGELKLCLFCDMS